VLGLGDERQQRRAATENRAKDSGLDFWRSLWKLRHLSSVVCHEYLLKAYISCY